MFLVFCILVVFSFASISRMVEHLAQSDKRLASLILTILAGAVVAIGIATADQNPMGTKQAIGLSLLAMLTLVATPSVKRRTAAASHASSP